MEGESKLAFKVSNKAFEQAFSSNEGEIKTIRTSKEIVDDFLYKLSIYLKQQSHYPAAKAISNWISKGGSLSAFTCRADMVEPMINALRRESIPFVIVQEMTGNKGFIIRSKDNEMQRKIANHLLKTSAKYCQVKTGKEASEEYLRRRIQDKNMLAVGDVTPEQLVYLEELCNQILPGETIGVDKMEDGTYLVTVHGQTAIIGPHQYRGRNFAAALSETLFLFDSNVKKEMLEISSNTNEFRKAKSEGFLDKDNSTQQPVWIVGKENIFVKRTMRGFEVGHAEEIGEEVFLETDYRVSFDDPQYDTRLNSGLSKITDKKVLYRLQDVIDHYKTKKSQIRNAKIEGEKHLMEEVDYIVANKVRSDAAYVRGNNWAAKLKHYATEVHKVLSATKDGRIPVGYSKEQIVSLMDITHRYKIDLSIATPAINKLKNVEVFDRPAGPPKIRSIEQEIARFSKGREEQAPGMERQSVGRDDGR